MAKFEDLKGQKFGYWTVVERAENHPATRSAQWLCECECGTKKTDYRWFPCWQKQDMQSRLSEKKFPEAKTENQLSTNT